MNYQEAASYWEQKDAQTTQMDRNSLLKEIEKFILAHNTCALATGFGDFVRCTPIEYNYYSGKFWLFSEGGFKFKALKNNKNVCLAIYDPYTGFDKLGGMQVVGKAALVEPWSQEYLNLLYIRKFRLKVSKNRHIRYISFVLILPELIFYTRILSFGV